MTTLCFLCKKWPWLRYGFLVLATAELFSFAQANLPSFDYQALKARATVIQRTYDQDPGDYRVLGYKGNMALGTSALDIWGEDPVLPARYARFALASQQSDFYGEILRKSFYHQFPPCLGLLRLRYIFEEREGKLAARRSGLKETPRAFLADRFEILSPDAILSRTVSKGFKPASAALLETDPGLPKAAGKLKGRITLNDFSSDEIRLDAQVSRPCLLVMTENYSHGWKARPELPSAQTAYQVMPAYGFLRAIPLGAGEHHILLYYCPAAYVAGKWISLGSWLVLFLLFAWIAGTNGFKKKLNL